MITDVHTHSKFSADGRSPLSDMLARAAELGTAYYGVSEHFDYDYQADGVLAEGKEVPLIDAEAYFPAARALQRQYAPRMRVLVGGEFGYTPTQAAIDRYLAVIETFRPDFIVNSVHTVDGLDPWFAEYFAGKTRRPWIHAGMTLHEMLAGLSLKQISEINMTLNKRGRDKHKRESEALGIPAFGRPHTSPATVPPGDLPEFLGDERPQEYKPRCRRKSSTPQAKSAP